MIYASSGIFASIANAISSVTTLLGMLTWLKQKAKSDIIQTKIIAKANPAKNDLQANINFSFMPNDLKYP